uniref:Uncharacterized protein n=1 Tax=Nelumbo nucifera TaxID=4432 RepID=A0A822ZLK7_NELNU|nr:TPA_asm: hypothetical protein HUJ06_003580 [Nelumbo nucifera]
MTFREHQFTSIAILEVEICTLMSKNVVRSQYQRELEIRSPTPLLTLDKLTLPYFTQVVFNAKMK